AKTIQAILTMPKPTPYTKLMPASRKGIPKTATATRTAVPAPAIAHQCGFTLSPASNPNSTRIGSAATRVERIQLCSGSYTWVHAMVASLLTTRSLRQAHHPDDRANRPRDVVAVPGDPDHAVMALGDGRGGTM